MFPSKFQDEKIVPIKFCVNLLIVKAFTETLESPSVGWASERGHLIYQHLILLCYLVGYLRISHLHMSPFVENNTYHIYAVHWNVMSLCWNRSVEDMPWREEREAPRLMHSQCTGGSYNRIQSWHRDAAGQDALFDPSVQGDHDGSQNSSSQFVEKVVKLIFFLY